MDPELEPIPQPETKPTRPFLLPLLLTAVVILSLASALLAYQNMQLKKQITLLQTDLSPTPTVIIDSKEDWKTYLKSNWNISFDLSDDWSNSVILGDGSFFSKNTTNAIVLKVNKGKYYKDALFDPYSQSFTTDQGQYVNGGSGSVKISDFKVEERVASLISYDSLASTQESPSYSYIYVIKDAETLFTLTFTSQDGDKSKVNIVNNKKIFDQILSTFTFLDNEKTSTTYACPSNGWVDCMPILDETKKKACSPEAMSWYETNCPNFQGGAL